MPYDKKMKRISAPESGFAVQQLNSWIQEGPCNIVRRGIPARWPSLLHDFDILKKQALSEKAGIRLGKAGEHEWIPDHELALANILKPEIPLLDVEKPDAFDFYGRTI
jgi:hypothetical protein